MTQVVTDVMARDGGVLGREIPRPRGVTSVPPVVPAARTSEPASLEPVTRTLPSSRTWRTWPAVTLDLTLALAAALTLSLGGWSPGQVELPAAVATALVWPLLLAVSGRYRRQALGQTRSARLGIVLAAGARTAVLALAIVPLVWEAPAASIGMLVASYTAASAVPFLGSDRRRRPRVVLVGRVREVRDAMAQLQGRSTHEVVAACLTRPSKTALEGDVPVYVGLESCSVAAHDHGADALVVLPGARLSPVEVRRLHWSLGQMGTELFLGTGLLDVEPQRTRVMSTAGLGVLHVGKPSLRGPRRLVKEVAERILALVALVLALPVLAALAIAIRLETPGPAIFRQERIGRDGVPFTMLKLRSMGIDAEAARLELDDDNEKDGVLFKIAADPRVTRLGRHLRRFSLDELPQLWNVVRGDMSLVGPRPALPCEVACYGVDPQRRLIVKPGLTGLWQVSGRSDLTWAESVRLDLKYVENWSLRLDALIVARTISAVLTSRGAY